MEFLNLALAAIAIASSSPADAARCAMTADEKAWVERSIIAWDWVRSHRLKIPPQSEALVVLFNDKCRFEARARSNAVWRAEPHAGVIDFPNGEKMDVGVTSGAMSNGDTGEVFFAMSLPSIWEAAKIMKPDDRDALTGVFLHEFSHVTQAPVLKTFFDAAKARFPEPENLSDDRIQELFGKDPAYAAVAEKEQEILFEAAHEPDDTKAKALVRNAFALRDSRQKRWFVGADETWTAYDDIFLTMEGYGQWVAYAWLSDPAGGGLAPAAAENKMRGGRRWWSQETGLSLFLLLDRFVPGWSAKAFAAEPKLATDLLREAVSERSSAPPAT